MTIRKEFERTIVIADDAVEQIRGNQIPAYPKTYEVWYAHLAGNNKDLSEAIHDMYQKYGRVSAGQILHLHETFVENSGLGDKVDQMGSQITGEANFLEKIIKKSHMLSQDFGVSLKQAAKDLEIELDQQTLQKLIKRVTFETIAAEAQNQELLEQLKAAHAGIQKLHKNLEEVREETLMDQLTMIGNRRHFDRSLQRAIVNHHVSLKPMCLILADIDHFKNFNDKWGHQTGDQVLKLVALAIKGNVKVEDVACRYGGEEFGIILSNTTTEQGKAVADSIRLAVAKRDVVKRSTGENLGKITISGGVAGLSADDTPETLINRADRCLYAAKNAGRNQFLMEDSLQKQNVA